MDNVTQLRPKGAFSPFVALLAIQVLFAGDLARMGIAMALVSRTIATGHCEASYTAIADDLGIAKRTVDRHMPAIVSTGILHRTDPMVPFRYRWDLARLAELAATREQSLSKPHFREAAHPSDGLTAEQHAACDAYRSALEVAARRHFGPQWRPAWFGRWYGCDRLEHAQAIGDWVFEQAHSRGVDLERAAAHLAATYVTDSRERERAGSGNALEQGLPIGWTRQVLGRAAATFRAAGSRVRPEPRDEGPPADLGAGAGAVLAAIGGAR